LPLRPWFRNYIETPKFYAGYRAKTLLGIREAIKNRNGQEAKEQIQVAAEVLERYAAAVRKMKAALNEARK
jgi:N-acetylated-alpha-linked acidic dipeptidase